MSTKITFQVLVLFLFLAINAQANDYFQDTTDVKKFQKRLSGNSVVDQKCPQKNFAFIGSTPETLSDVTNLFFHKSARGVNLKYFKQFLSVTKSLPGFECRDKDNKVHLNYRGESFTIHYSQFNSDQHGDQYILRRFRNFLSNTSLNSQ